MLKKVFNKYSPKKDFVNRMYIKIRSVKKSIKFLLIAKWNIYLYL